MEKAGELGTDVHIELLPGTPILANSQDSNTPQSVVYRSLQELPQMPINGSSIGARGCTNEAGTVGAFVYFQPPGKTDKVLYFLTCYHVIRCGDQKNRLENDEFGIGLRGQSVKARITIDYPAPFDAAKTKTSLQSEIDKGQDPSGSKAQIIQIIDKHFAAGGIGHVIHSSGYYRQNSNQQRMDWALIRLTVEKIAPPQNKPPPRSSFTPLHLHNGNLEYEVANNEVVTNVGVLSKGDWVAKVGRTSGISSGEVNAMKSTVHWYYDDANDARKRHESKEIEIVSFNGGECFLFPGDSGSMLFNQKKEWVGIAVGMLAQYDHGYVLSAQAIAQDIKDSIGGTITVL